jgi:hypothetical protein
MFRTWERRRLLARWLQAEVPFIWASYLDASAETRRRVKRGVVASGAVFLGLYIVLNQSTIAPALACLAVISFAGLVALWGHDWIIAAQRQRDSERFDTRDRFPDG